MSCKIKIQKTHGFSLLETMLASVFGLILLASIYHVYLIVKKNYLLEEDLSELQNNIRYASFTLKHNIRTVGFSGCRKIADLQAEKHFITHTKNFDFSLENSLHGFSSNNVPVYLQDKILQNTDALIIQKADADITNLAINITPPTATFYVYQNPATQNNKILLLSDCDYVDFFETKDAGGSVITLQDRKKIEHAYNVQDSRVARFAEIAYFIGNTFRKDKAGKPIYALFQIINQGNREELVAGINNMQIHYGVKDGAGKITYYKSLEVDQLKSWSDVKTVAIDLDFVYQNLPKKISIYTALRERL